MSSTTGRYWLIWAEGVTWLRPLSGLDGSMRRDLSEAEEYAVAELVDPDRPVLIEMTITARKLEEA